jgi:hypothetical protein
MLKWRVYYDDDSTFDSSQGSPADSPGWGVVACVSIDKVEGHTLQSLSDYYVYDPSCGWVGVDLCGLFDRLGNRVPTEAVCFGRMLPNTVYERVYDKALNDPDFPRKTGKRYGER